MADGGYGEREIVIDLSVTGAREIRKTPELIAIKAIKISGVEPGASGTIVLREDNASGRVIFRRVVGTETVNETTNLGDDRPSFFRGLYMDAIPNAWTAPATLVIYTV